MRNNTFKQLTTHEVATRMKNKEDLLILDVRELNEWIMGHIPQAKHIPLGEIPYRLDELDPKKETVIVCRSGNRSAGAAEFLTERGYQVINMAGGMLEWPGEMKREI